MKNLAKLSLLMFVFLFAGCATANESFIATRIAQDIEKTMESMNSGLVEPAGLNEIQDSLTEDNSSEKSSIPTSTPNPTIPPTPTFTPTPKPIFNSSPQTLAEGVLNPDSEIIEAFPIVTVNDVSLKRTLGSMDAAEGNVLAKIDVTMQNPGENVSTLGSQMFVLVDGNGVSHDTEYVNLDCYLDWFVDVFPGGVLEGCIIFEIPDLGNFELHYAPYRYDRFGVGRSLKWEVDYSSVEESVSAPITNNGNMDEGLVVESFYIYGDYGLGMLKNVSDKPKTNLEMEITTFSEGSVVETTKGIIWGSNLFPNERKPFFATFLNYASDYDEIEINTDGETLSQFYMDFIYNEFVVEDFELSPGDGGRHETQGRIKNIGPSDGEWVGILIAGFNSKGDIIGFGQALAGFEEPIKPGDTQPIEGSFKFGTPSLESELDHFEFYIEGNKK
jgi:hypothetical protein